MGIEVVSFGGHNVQDATYESGFLESQNARSGEISAVLQRPLRGAPGYVRGEERELLLPLDIVVKTPTLANIEQLTRWFRPGTQGALVVSFDGVERALDCVAVNFRAYAGTEHQFVATLLAPDRTWRSRSRQRATAAVTSSPATVTATNAGNATEPKALLRLQPTAFKPQASGQRYKREVVLANRVADAYANEPLELTEGVTWDHAADAAAGRSLASGNDVRVLLDGVEIPRWPGEAAGQGFNSTDLRLWANFDLAPRKTAQLLAAITATAPLNGEDLEVEPGDTAGWPERGALMTPLGEVIEYYGTTETAFRDVVRGARGTTAATAAAGDTVYWVEHRVQIVYGWLNAPAPAARTDVKPLLNLASTTLSNTRHEWTQFYDPVAPGRAGAWSRRLRNDDSQASKMLAPTLATGGELAFEYRYEGPVAGKPNFNAWYRKFPSGTGKSGGNMASLTRAVADSLAMKVYGADGAGQETTLATYNGALGAGAVDIADAGAQYRLEFYGRSQVASATPTGLTRSPAVLAAGTDLDAVASWTFQKVTVPSGGAGAVTIPAIAAHVAPVLTNQSVTAVIFSDAGGSPGTRLSDTPSQTVPVGVGSAWTTWQFAAPVHVAGGQVVHVGLKDSSADGNAVNWNSVQVVYEGSATPKKVKLLSDSAGFADQAKAVDGAQATVDGLTVHLDAAGVPYVALKGQQDAYQVTAALRNNATGQELAFATLVGLTDVLEVDVAAAAARNLAGCPFALNASGNEITDLTRARGLEGDGRTAPDSSVGIWEASANEHQNGGFTVDTSGWTVNAAALDRVAAGGLFGAAHGRVTAAASLDNHQARYARSALLTAGQQVALSGCFRRVNNDWIVFGDRGDGTAFHVVYFNLATGAVGSTYGTADAKYIVPLGNGWYRCVVVYTHGSGGAVTQLVGLTDSDHNGADEGAFAAAGTEAVDIDGMQIEVGKSVATPYIETAGASASRAAARVQMPVHDLFSEAQGGVVVRLRMGMSSAALGASPGAGTLRVFEAGATATERVAGFITAAGGPSTTRQAATGTTTVSSGAATWAAGDSITSVHAWEATRVRAAKDAGLLVSTAGANVPSGLGMQADIGRRQFGGADQWIDSEVLWAVTFEGVLTDADVAALHRYGDTEPTFDDLRRDLAAEAMPTAIWAGRDLRFQRAGLPTGRSVVATVTPSDEDGWLELAAGANALEYREPGVAGMRLEALFDHRWS